MRLIDAEIWFKITCIGQTKETLVLSQTLTQTDIDTDRNAREKDGRKKLTEILTEIHRLDELLIVRPTKTDNKTVSRRKIKREAISAILSAALWSFFTMVTNQNIRKPRGPSITAVSAVLPVHNAIKITGINGAGIKGDGHLSWSVVMPIINEYT